MAADTLELRLLLAARRAVLAASALRHALRLLRLGARNALTLRVYRRACRRASGRGGARRGSPWLPLRRYASLFRPHVELETPEERAGRRRLLDLYAEARAACARDRPRLDPVRAESAVALQGAVVRRAFARSFGLTLAADDARALAGYGSPALAMRDFLEYCGCGAGAPSRLPLAVQVPGFVVHTLVRHGQVESRRQTLRLLAAAAGASRGPRAWWRRLAAFVSRVHWTRGDARERLARMALRVEALRAERLHVARSLKERADPVAQASLLAVLADQMHLRAALVLAELAEETRRAAEARQGTTPGDLLARHEFEFMRAVHGLEENLRATLSRDERRAGRW